jgi:hypothetical protein
MFTHCPLNGADCSPQKMATAIFALSTLIMVNVAISGNGGATFVNFLVQVRACNEIDAISGKNLVILQTRQFAPTPSFFRSG